MRCPTDDRRQAYAVEGEKLVLDALAEHDAQAAETDLRPWRLSREFIVS
jgi:hypothetical protein